MSEAAPIVTTHLPARRWLARAWSATRQRVAGPPRLAMYAFGKHPAFADFIDVGRLPPVPEPFRHFHDVLRSAVERDGGPGGPVLIAWQDRGASAVLWVQPSHDRAEAATGRFRRCPLLLGMTAHVPLAELLPFAAGRLAALAGEVAMADAEGVFSRIRAAAAEWAIAVPAAGETTGRSPFDLAEVPDGDAVVVAGEGDRFAEGMSMSSATPAMLASWTTRATGDRR